MSKTLYGLGAVQGFIIQNGPSINFAATVLTEGAAVSSKALFAMGTSVIKIIGNEAGKHHDESNSRERGVEISCDHHKKANSHQNIS